MTSYRVLDNSRVRKKKYSHMSLEKGNQGKTNKQTNCMRQQCSLLDQFNGVLDLTLFISAV